MVKPADGIFTLLVTGSRTWNNYDFIRHSVAHVKSRFGLCWLDRIRIRHGGAAGADSYASALCQEQPWAYYEEVFRPDYDKHGRGAPHMRDAKMVDLGIDACVGFIRDNSNGATFTSQRAYLSGAPVWEYHYNSQLDRMDAYYRNLKDGIDGRTEAGHDG